MSDLFEYINGQVIAPAPAHRGEELRDKGIAQVLAGKNEWTEKFTRVALEILDRAGEVTSEQERRERKARLA